jgi:hypothetical protein
MFRMKFAAVAVAAVLLSASAFAQGPTFTRIDNPLDPTFNALLSINNSGVISGYFGSGQAGHPNQAYTVAPPYTTFAPANVPGATQTQTTAITANGARAGFWAATINGIGLDANFGFIREANGSTYLVNNPLGAGHPYVNQLLGMNAANIAVGFYNDGNGVLHAYTYKVKTGVFTPLTVPGAVSTVATGINSNNLICGYFVDGAGITGGFVKPIKGGTTTAFQVPGFTVTQLLGINALGLAVGFYADAQNIPHGVVYNTANGSYTVVNDPAGVNGTVLNGINDQGQIVGYYTDGATNTHGILVTGVE